MMMLPKEQQGHCVWSVGQPWGYSQPCALGGISAGCRKAYTI